MLVAVGLTTSDLKSLDHSEVAFSSAGALDVYNIAQPLSSRAVLLESGGLQEKPAAKLPAGKKVSIKVKKSSAGCALEVFDSGKKLFDGNGWVLLKGPSDITFLSVKRAGASGNVGAKYHGSIAVFIKGEKLRVALILDLDKYLRGVLQSEIPASYHIEAVKAQAVAARTYGLNPRINHEKDTVNVCDSYLCCQYFGGLTTLSSPVHERAIRETLGQVLTFEGKPILALFSSNGGGHTENYENCFSDPQTGQFPPPRLPCLVGVPESEKFSYNLAQEADLRKFYNSTPHTVDSDSHHFKWKVHLTADDIESNIHATVQAMQKDERAPFVVAPSSGKFGHVISFAVAKRGVSGCAIEVDIKTSGGVWKVSKELVIRDLFKTPEKKLARLKSARIFFDQDNDQLGHLSSLTISGLGWGHGVGLQQTGAQGWAKAGWNYRSILAHYFRSAKIEKV
jgi:stage II sporulation protein D